MRCTGAQLGAAAASARLLSTACGSPGLQVGALGSVKRTRDGTELARRDVTIVDQRCAAAATCSPQGSTHSARLCQLRATAAPPRLPACDLPSCSAKTVVVTLWGTAAEEDGAALERLDNAVLSIASCRVTDFAGAA